MHFLLAAILAAVVLPPVHEADFVIPQYRFADGETLQNVRIHYATLGTLRRDANGHATNAVLVLHGTGGSHQQFLNDHYAGVLFTPGGLLDAQKYFIIIPDNVGHGASSKPSDGLRRKFPHYGYRDMVDLQHRLVTEDFGVDHLYLVTGTSMGGMQTWLWGERYPSAMDALVPLASLPVQIAGRNRVWRKMATDALRDDPEHGLRTAIDLLMIATSSPLQWQKTSPTAESADRWLDDQMKTRLASNNADDLLYALESSSDYDPEPALESITAPLLAINSADDFVNPPELGILETRIKRVPHGSAIVIPTSDATRGHGTHTWAAVWEPQLRAFLA
ncbi:MAG TPA: alpha/beta fold hydrolase, partial [Thermoanaerobaculia bacterium]|nr:alpha/beta fold hydrolase [Thermoanaerobaculia bacterium]